MYYPIELSATRSVIKHSWLENRILNKTPDAICALWLTGDWKALNGEFLDCERDAEMFGQTFVESFSPARLVDLVGPLTQLDSGDKAALRTWLHEAYLAKQSVSKLAPMYMKALVELRGGLAALRKAWLLSRPEGRRQIHDCARRVVASAGRLRDIMEQIPKGLVLP